jgi:hypothetical protein
VAKKELTTVRAAAHGAAENLMQGRMIRSLRVSKQGTRLPAMLVEPRITNSAVRHSFIVPASATAVYEMGRFRRKPLPDHGLWTIDNIHTSDAHRFFNDGRELTLVEQLLDSVNYPKFSIIAEMWGPVGLRYDPLLHLFPSLPSGQTEFHFRWSLSGLMPPVYSPALCTPQIACGKDAHVDRRTNSHATRSSALLSR